MREVRRVAGMVGGQRVRPSDTRLTPPARLLHERRAIDLGTRTPGDSGPGGAVASEPRGKMALNDALSDGSRSCRALEGALNRALMHVAYREAFKNPAVELPLLAAEPRGPPCPAAAGRA